MTTPLELADNLARSPEYRDRVLAVAIISRGLSDGDPATFKLGWPLDMATAQSAAHYLDLDINDELCLDALALAPTLSDALLNKRVR